MQEKPQTFGKIITVNPVWASDVWTCTSNQDFLVYVVRTAYLCLNESGWKKRILGSDSTAAATDLYKHEMRPVKNRHDFEMVKIRQYLKWHITAVLDHLVILRSRITSKRTHDSLVLKTQLSDNQNLAIKSHRFAKNESCSFTKRILWLNFHLTKW